MIVASSRDPGYLSNAFVVAAEPGGPACFVDAGAPLAPLLAFVEERALRPTHLLVTHRHGDHVAHLPEIVSRFGCRVIAHEKEAPHVPGADLVVAHGDEIAVGPLAVRVLWVPGHTTGHAAFLVDGEAVFSGDTLFRGSVGGNVGPGHASIGDLKRSVLDVLLGLPPGTAIHPGHMESTTVAEEERTNPFVRAWRGADPIPPTRCEAMGRPADLLLRATDYDGGTKCWVRFADGEEAVVPGSRVTP